MYIPVATDQDAAPADILNVVRCKCRMDTGNPCSSHLCSCRKHGLHCVPACKNCTGTSCSNADISITGLSDSEDEDDIDDMIAENNELDHDDDTAFDDDILDCFIPWVTEEVVQAM